MGGGLTAVVRSQALRVMAMSKGFSLGRACYRLGPTSLLLKVKCAEGCPGLGRGSCPAVCVHWWGAIGETWAAVHVGDSWMR